MFARTRWRLAGWNLLVLALTLIFISGAVYAAFSRTFLSEVDRNLESQGREMLREASESRGHLGGEGYEGGLFTLVVAGDGQILENPQQVRATKLSLAQSFTQSVRYETGTVNSEPARLYVQPLTSGPWTGGSLVIGQSLSSQQSTLHRLLVVILATAGAGLLIAAAGAWFLSGKALTPIQEAFRRQQEFAADASHELRTPLAVMRSAADLLARHRDEPLNRNGELLDDIRSGISRLERLTGDLLTLARHDAGKLELAVGHLDLAALADDVARRMMPLADEHEIRLTITASDPTIVEADPDRLEQVLVILLDNALKHTPAGGTVTVTAKHDGGDAVIEIRDTGEGIPAEHLPRVFERFYRTDMARSRRDGGSGLGLAIAKAVVDAHGGQLTLNSRPGAGTTAALRFRLVPSPTPKSSSRALA